MANYEAFYQGTPYSMEPGYGQFIGYRMSAGSLGLTTDPRTAFQVKEVSDKLSSGVKQIEVSVISPEIMESIPEQHLDEIRRLSKLTGIDVSVHAPIIEPSGVTREGWTEASRMAVERQMMSAVERAKKLSPEGNIPVTFHSTAGLPEMEEKVMTKEGLKTTSVWIVDPRTGKFGKIEAEERFFPGQKGPFNPKKEIDRMNQESWMKTLGNVNYYASRGEEFISHVLKEGENLIEKNPEITKKLGTHPYLNAYSRYKSDRKFLDALPDEERRDFKEKFRLLNHGEITLRDSYEQLKQLYNMAYKNPSPETKAKLDAFANKISPIVETIDKDPTKLSQFAELVEEGVQVLGEIHPNIYQPLNNFVVEKSADTFADVALASYKKFGNQSPIISIENPPAGMGISKAEDLKKLIEESRKKFIEKAAKEGYSAGEAKEMAEKLIGATWDVGHINMLRKYGYEKEDILKETEKIAPFVKHAHLSDNFGFEHTELPMGMGNVPVAEIMEKLGKEGFEGKKIIEAGNWWQHFKTSPVGPTLEAFGSPVYAMAMAPYWNQAAGLQQGYFAGFGTYLPEQHFSMYGSGFSTLPTELGGQMPGRQSRVSGTPMD